MITNDARCAREIESTISMAKTEFKRKKDVLTKKFNLNLRRKLVQCYIWSIPVLVAET
jgi:hypothetical protein